MKTEIHGALKHKHIAVRYYFLLGKFYSVDTCSKMFHQDLKSDNINEKNLLRVLKELISEQKQLLK